MRRPLIVLSLAVLLAVGASSPRASEAPEADDKPASVTGRTFHEVGKGFKELGKQLGLEVADAAKKVWYKGKKVSGPKLDQVQDRTREFWRKVIEGKDRALEELRRENANLKKRTAHKRTAG